MPQKQSLLYWVDWRTESRQNARPLHADSWQKQRSLELTGPDQLCSSLKLTVQRILGSFSWRSLFPICGSQPSRWLSVVLSSWCLQPCVVPSPRVSGLVYVTNKYSGNCEVWLLWLGHKSHYSSCWALIWSTHCKGKPASMLWGYSRCPLERSTQGGVETLFWEPAPTC